MPNAELRPIESIWGHLAGGPGFNKPDSEFIDNAINEIMASWFPYKQTVLILVGLIRLKSQTCCTKDFSKVVTPSRIYGSWCLATRPCIKCFLEIQLERECPLVVLYPSGLEAGQIHALYARGYGNDRKRFTSWLCRILRSSPSSGVGTVWKNLWNIQPVVI